MDLNLTDKIVLITGSSRGIGLAIAKSFHQEGAQVILNGRDKASLEAVSKDFSSKVDFILADVVSYDECKRLIAQIKKQYGRLDVLICNVGSSASVKPGEETVDEWRKMLDVNLMTATNMVSASQELLASSQGSIVCISSICGSEVISGAPVTYSVAKSALNAFVREISRPLGGLGIRINAVAPGNILFKGSVWDRKLKENSKAVNQMLQDEVALQRLGQAEEIADFVTFLSSSRASFSTGTIYTLDGGQLRG